MFLYLIGVMKYLAKTPEVLHAGRIHFRVSVISVVWLSLVTHLRPQMEVFTK